MTKPRTERNAEIYNLRIQHPKQWTYKKLGEKFHISISRITQIFEKAKYDKSKTKKEYFNGILRDLDNQLLQVTKKEAFELLHAESSNIEDLKTERNKLLKQGITVFDKIDKSLISECTKDELREEYQELYRQILHWK